MLTELRNLRISPMPKSANINGSRKVPAPKSDEPLYKQRYRTVHLRPVPLCRWDADEKNVTTSAKILRTPLRERTG